MTMMQPLLATWRSLNETLYRLTEAEVHALLEQELAGEARSDFIVRLHQRYTALRSQRERAELLSKAKR